MKKSFLYIVISVVLLFNSLPNLHSQSFTSEIKTKIESWYLLLGIGYADISYPGLLQSEVDVLKELPGASHLPVNLNFGIYMPLTKDKCLLGIALTADADRFESSGSIMQINTYLLGGSFIYHITDFIGDGLYARGDAGIALEDISSDFSRMGTKSVGYGLKGGIGYALPISLETRILFDFAYTYRKIISENSNSMSFGIAILL